MSDTLKPKKRPKTKNNAPVNKVRYLRVGKAAEYLGLHPDTLRNWEEQGLLVPLRFGSRQDRIYTTAQLDKFFALQTKITPVSTPPTNALS